VPPISPCEMRSNFASKIISQGEQVKLFTFYDEGLNGFDSRLNGYVSMPSLVIRLVNLRSQTITGETNYALAA